MKPTVTYTYTGDEGEKIQVELPTKMEVCDDCEGYGTVLNEAIRSHAYSQEEFEEAFSDDASREQYFKRGGVYDVPCPTCHGRNVVPVVDESRLTGAQKNVFARIQQEQREYDEALAADLATRRMESGQY